MTLNSGIHSISNHKLLIYQLIPRLFGNKVSLNQPYGSRAENGCGTFADIDITALQAIKALGCTHIWLTGIIDHATCTDHADIGKPSSPPETVKGRAGSPYAIRDYFDISPDLAIQPANRMAEFLDLTVRAHEQGLRVIIDHVPNHVARTYQGISRPAATKDMGEDDDTQLSFSPGNDFYYLPGSSLELSGEAYAQARLQMPEATSHTYTENPARATGNDVFHAQPSTNDWYETVKCNYGRSPHGIGHYTPIPPLWLKMKEILRFWALKGIDGFRCDMAGMVPVEYWEWVIHELKEEWPQLLFIAEIYEPWHYESYLRAGFDYLYDKVGFYDTLRNVMTGQEPASALSRSWQEGGEFRHRMLRFVENHDEQRIASKHFCGSPEPGIPATAAAMFLHPGPVLLYNGQESGESGDEASGFSGADGRTSIFDYWGMTRHQLWMNKGKFDGEGLDVLQKEILREYQRLGTLATSEQAVLFGELFDLQYAQDIINDYDGTFCFSFLRHHKGHVLLFVLSFASDPLSVRVRIPSLAFHLSGMREEGRVRVLELGHSDEKVCHDYDAALFRDHGIALQLRPWSANVFRLEHDSSS